MPEVTFTLEDLEPDTIAILEKITGGSQELLESMILYCIDEYVRSKKDDLQRVQSHRDQGHSRGRR